MRSIFRRGLICLSLLSATFARADDWPQWGGPQRDLVWRETGIVKEFATREMLPRKWSTPIAAGYAGPAVADGKVFVTDRIGETETERVHCLDAETGKILWTHSYRVRYTIDYPFGPRATPTIDGDRVYTIGAQGNLFCLNVADGSVIWSKEFERDFGTTLPAWGMAGAPLVDGEQLIALVGGEKNSLLVSFDKRTGKELWRSLDDPQVGYAPPLKMTFGGKAQIVLWHQSAISSVDPETGEKLWSVPFDVKYALTAPNPRQQGNRLFVSAFYDGPLMLEVANDGLSAKTLWKGKSDSELQPDGIHAIICTPVFTPTHIYGVSSYGQLVCQDAQTGKVLWETREATGEDRWWNAFIIPHEDRYFIHNEQGELIIADLSPEGYKEISRAKLIEP
ncbi:MAG TPA: PQQ-binding-like beta-propeller repeat protein, partial [Planctomycetaceae bacterium]|nr:PQQ-binding-like beta-propeller repeat protein [Planctomycetaceae bacterium]